MVNHIILTLKMYRYDFYGIVYKWLSNDVLHNKAICPCVMNRQDISQAVHSQNRPGNDLQTVIWASYQCFTTVLISVPVVYHTDMTRTRTTGKRPFPSLFLPPSLSPHLLSCYFKEHKGKSHHHIYWGNQSYFVFILFCHSDGKHGS